LAFCRIVIKVIRNDINSEAPPAKLEASGSPLKGGSCVGKAPLGLC